MQKEKVISQSILKLFDISEEKKKLYFTQTCKNVFGSNQSNWWFMYFILPLKALENRWQSVLSPTSPSIYESWVLRIRVSIKWLIAHLQYLWKAFIETERQGVHLETGWLIAIHQRAHYSLQELKRQAIFHALKTLLSTRWRHKITP